MCHKETQSQAGPAEHHRNVPGDREPWWTTTNILHSEEKKFQEKSTWISNLLDISILVTGLLQHWLQLIAGWYLVLMLTCDPWGRVWGLMSARHWLSQGEWGGLTHIQMTARGNILLWSNILNITLIKQQQVVICWVFLRFCNVLMLPLKSWSSSNECYISSTHDCHTSYYRVWPDNSCVTECHHYTKYHYHHCHYHHHYPDIWDRYQLAASPALSLGADIKLIWECAEHSEHY